MRLSFLLTALLFVTANLSAQNSSLDLLVKAAANQIDNPASQANILRGMRASLQGRRGIPEPNGWSDLYAKIKDSPNEEVRSLAQTLSVIFGAGAAIDEMRAKLLDPNAPVGARKQALDALVAQRDTGAVDSLVKLAADPGPLREPALRALAVFDDPRIGSTVVKAFPNLDTTERRAAIQALLARTTNAKAFIGGIESNAIPKNELTAPVARQLQGLKDPDIDAWLAKNWGALHPQTADKQKLIAKFKEFLHPDLILRADANRGRALFSQTCGICHTMWGIGGKIGPELTGGYEDLDYLLNNILDPNAIIGKDYQQTTVTSKDGQILSGIVTQDTDSSISLKTLTGEIVTLQKSDVASTEVSPFSMMPEGLLTAMDEESVRDLFLYLRLKHQSPMLVTPINSNDFFNGNNLQNWVASPADSWKINDATLVCAPGSKPATLSSEMVASDFKLTARIQAAGEKLAAEMVLAGAFEAGQLNGLALSFGGPSAVNLWGYEKGAPPEKFPGKRSITGDKWHSLEIVRKGDNVRVILDGAVEFDRSDPRYRVRLTPAFAAQGGGELRIKDLQIQAL